MRRPLGPLVAIALLASACQLAGPAGLEPVRARRTPAPGEATLPPATPLATSGATGRPSAAPPVVAVPTPPAPELLRAPPRASTRLKGVVKVDASYMLAAGAGTILPSGAGRVISHNGAQVLPVGGGNGVLPVGGGNGVLPAGGGHQVLPVGGGNGILPTGGGNVISHNGSAMVAAGAGNLLSDNGGAVIPVGGGNQILPAGGGNQVVPVGGGNQVVPAGGGNQILPVGGGHQVVPVGGGHQFRLAQAGATPGPTPTPAATPTAGVARGELMPAAYAEIAVRSMRTGRYLPVGVDGAGQPVYVVFTDQAGGYELYLPEAERDNVLIEVNAARELRDPRLEYAAISGVVAGAGEAVVDEDTAAVTEMLRKSFAVRLAGVVMAPSREKAVASIVETPSGNIQARIPAAILPLMTEAFGAIWDAADRAQLRAEPDPRVRLGYMFLLTDAIMRTVPLADLRIRPGTFWDGPEEPAIAGLVDILRTARAKATEKLADPAFFTREAWFVGLNERAGKATPPRGPYEVRKAADLGRVVIDEYVAIDEADRDFSPPVTAPADCGPNRGCDFSADALKTLLKAIGANGLPPSVAGPDARTTAHGLTTKGGRTQTDRIVQAQYDIVVALVTALVTLSPEDRAAVTGVLDGYRRSAP